MLYERMVEKIIPIYSYSVGCFWNIGMVSRYIRDGYLPNALEYDGYGCRI